VPTLTAILDWFYDPRTLRWLRPVRRVAAAALLGGLAWFVVTRLTTLPAAYQPGYPPTPAELSLAPLEEAAAHVITLLQGDVATGVQGELMAWASVGAELSPMEGASNESARLAAVSADLARPEVAAALDTLGARAAVLSRAVAKHGWPRERLSGREPPPPAPVGLRTSDIQTDQDGGSWARTGVDRDIAMLRCATVLVWRARWHAVAQNDPHAAWVDLRDSLRIAQLVRLGRPWGACWDIRSPAATWTLALKDLTRLAAEHDLSPDLAAEIIAFLQSELGLSLSRTVLERCGLDTGPDDWLDQFYTRDAGGNGWLVVSHTQARDIYLLIRGFTRLNAGDTWAVQRSRAWNLASPLYLSRPAARAELLSLIAWIENLDSRALSTIPVPPYRLDSVPPCSTPFDAIVRYRPMEVGLRHGELSAVGAEVGQRRRAAVLVALSAWRAEHGAPPATLDELVPRYLPAIPLDPYTAQPLAIDRATDTKPAPPRSRRGEVLAPPERPWRRNEP
jgi:hypothetical protein